MHGGQAPQAHSQLTRQVLHEFSNLYKQLTDVVGVQVTLFQHHLEHGTPDAVFPNNWFSTHHAAESGSSNSSIKAQRTLVLYPMKCPNRAMERRADIVGALKTRGYDRVIDMSVHEKDKAYFEGTGKLVK